MDTLKQLFGDSLVGKKKLTRREPTLTSVVTGDTTQFPV